MTTYLIATGIVIVIILVMNLIQTKPKETSKSTMDSLIENSTFKEFQGLFDAMSKLNEGGTDDDTIPEGYGEFGYEKTNPIPVNTVFGNISYLGKLRTTEGKRIQHERIGSTSAPNINLPIDIYKISDGIEVIATLYMSPYNKKNSERPPRGFKLDALP